MVPGLLTVLWHGTSRVLPPGVRKDSGVPTLLQSWVNGELWDCAGASSCVTRTRDGLPTGGRGRVALSLTLFPYFLLLLLRLALGLRVLLMARHGCEHPGCRQCATAPGSCWPLQPPGGTAQARGQRWPGRSTVSIGGAALGRAGAARAYLSQPHLSPSVPPGAVPHHSPSPSLTPSVSSAADGCSTPAAPSCARLAQADLDRRRGCVPLLPACSAEGQHERVAGGGVCRGCRPPVCHTRPVQLLGTTMPAVGTEGEGRCLSGSRLCLLFSCHTHLLPLLSPAAIPPAHSSSVLAVPAPVPVTPPHLL